MDAPVILFYIIVMVYVYMKCVINMCLCAYVNSLAVGYIPSCGKKMSI